MITTSRSIIFNVAGAPVFEDGLEGKNFLHNKNHSVSMIGKSNNVQQRTSNSSHARANHHDSAKATTRTPTCTSTHPIPLSRARSPDTDAAAEVKEKTVENGPNVAGAPNYERQDGR